MKLIRGVSGVRGIVGKTLTKEVVAEYANGFSKIQPDKFPMLIARDSRTHGKSLAKNIVEILISSGRDVMDYGIIPTPTAQFLIQNEGFCGGIVITASHNPSNWNGLKFIDQDGCFLDNKKNQSLFNLVDNPSKIVHLNLGKYKSFINGFDKHIKHTLTLSCIDTKRIKNNKYKVVVDAVNGAASIALPKMLKNLGCEVICIHCKQDGLFPRGAEPLAKNLKDLSGAVKNNKADIGFATDPDGDRLAIIDENGIPIGEEYTLPMCADSFLNTKNNGIKNIVTNLSTTLALDRVAAQYGVNVLRTAVGEINVVNKMKEVGSVFGGEGNGGVIVSESHYGRDAIVAASLFLNGMANSNMKVSEMFKSMPLYYMKKEKLDLHDIDSGLALKNIKKVVKAESNELDGLKLIWEDSWVHVRKSNTEPILRIYAEAPTEKEVDRLIFMIKSIALKA